MARAAAVTSTAPLRPESHLWPGPPPSTAPDPRLVAFQADPQAIAAGKRYYARYNCNGCHFNGGGGIGPSFMDSAWRYGGTLEDIHDSIAQGRPNGMPVWALKIPDSRIWDIAAYVRSLSPPPTAAQPGAVVEAPPPPPAAAG
jgi:cytochrome c oxidase cbb3-type subunit 3